MRVQTAGRLNLIAFAVLMGLAAIALAGAVAMATSLTGQPARQLPKALPIPNAPPPRAIPITDPTHLPRLALEDLSYQGAFRLPADEINGVSFSAGGYPAAFNPERNSLFVGARGNFIAEVTIPEPVNSSDVEALPFATFLQRFSDPSEGRLKEIESDGVSLSGLLVHDHRLISSAVIFYDAVNAQALSHFSRPLALGEAGASKLVRVWENGKTGFVAGYMATVPPEWQSALGGPVVTGQCCLPIISRTSWGPSAFAFDPADINRGRNPNAEPLLYYDAAHPTLGRVDATGPSFNGATQVGGLALIPGTRTALFIGRHGTGTFCYGTGTGNQALNGTREGGESYCFDPASSDKGTHAYPYRYQVWAYDLAELAAVRANKRDPWDVKPYAVWPMTFPTGEQTVRIASVAHDLAGKRLFVLQMLADRDGYAYRPLVHVFRLP